MANIPNYIKNFYEYPKLKAKFIDCNSKVIELIFDDNEVFLITDPGAELLDSPALWSNNCSLIEALTNCFDNLWEKT